MKWKWLVCTLSLAVADCSPPREAPIDFCQEQGRRIPDKERFISALVDILPQEKKFVRDFGRNGVHYFSWRREYLAVHPDLDNRAIERAYLDAHPSCCETTSPSFLDPTRVSDEEWDSLSNSLMVRDQEWVAEVYIWRELPPHPDPKFNERIGRISSVCNDKITYLGYLHAAIE